MNKEDFNWAKRYVRSVSLSFNYQLTNEGQVDKLAHLLLSLVFQLQTLRSPAAQMQLARQHMSQRSMAVLVDSGPLGTLPAAATSTMQETHIIHDRPLHPGCCMSFMPCMAQTCWLAWRGERGQLGSSCWNNDCAEPCGCRHAADTLRHPSALLCRLHCRAVMLVG